MGLRRRSARARLDADLIFGNLPRRREKTGFELPAEIPEGERNETLHRYACSLRGTGGGLEFAEILNAVSAANESRCNPPLPVGDVRTLIESACKHPKGNGKPHVMNDSTEQSGGAATADDDDKLAICEIADMITADAHLAVDTGGKLYVFDGGVYKPSGEELPEAARQSDPG